MRYVSVCAGIEAASVAWHDLGWEPVCFSEIEPFPCAVLKHHYPDVPLVGDFTQLIANPPSADLLVGGTPCQAFSVAGKRLSLEDYRGNLSLAFADLWHAGEYEWAVWENVPGVLSTKDNAFGCFLGRLVGSDGPLAPGAKSGKWSKSGVVSGPQGTAAWRILDAQYFGVAQRRRRVFVLARRGAGNGDAPRALFPVLEGVLRDLAPRRETGKDVAGTPASHTSAGGGLGTDFDLAGGVITDPPRYLGNAEGGTGLPNLTASNMEKLVHNQSPVVGVPLPHHDRMRQREGKPGGGKGPLLSEDQSLTLAANTNDQVLFAVDKQTAQVTGDITSTLKTDLSHQRGPVVAVAGDITHALSAEGADASEDGTGRGTPVVAAFDVRNVTSKTNRTRPECGLPSPTLHAEPMHVIALRPRRLTPRECERLQGFPDDYTLIPWRKGVSADGPRYKALGNSMAVPVMRWIGQRIQQVVFEDIL